MAINELHNTQHSPHKPSALGTGTPVVAGRRRPEPRAGLAGIQVTSLEEEKMGGEEVGMVVEEL